MRHSPRLNVKCPRVPARAHPHPGAQGRRLLPGTCSQVVSTPEVPPNCRHHRVPSSQLVFTSVSIKEGDVNCILALPTPSAVLEGALAAARSQSESAQIRNQPVRGSPAPREGHWPAPGPAPEVGGGQQPHNLPSWLNSGIKALMHTHTCLPAGAHKHTCLHTHVYRPSHRRMSAHAHRQSSENSYLP